MVKRTVKEIVINGYERSYTFNLPKPVEVPDDVTGRESILLYVVCTLLGSEPEVNEEKKAPKNTAIDDYYNDKYSYDELTMMFDKVDK